MERASGKGHVISSINKNIIPITGATKNEAKLIKECLSNISIVSLVKLDQSKDYCKTEPLSDCELEVSRLQICNSDLNGMSSLSDPGFLLITDVRGGAVDVYHEESEANEKSSTDANEKSSTDANEYKITQMDSVKNRAKQFMHLLDAVEEMDKNVRNPSEVMGNFEINQQFCSATEFNCKRTSDEDSSSESDQEAQKLPNNDINNDTQSVIPKVVVTQKYSVNCQNGAQRVRKHRKRQKALDIESGGKYFSLNDRTHTLSKIIQNIRREIAHGSKSNNGSQNIPSELEEKYKVNHPKERFKLMQRHLNFEQLIQESQECSDQSNKEGDHSIEKDGVDHNNSGRILLKIESNEEEKLSDISKECKTQETTDESKSIGDYIMKKSMQEIIDTKPEDEIKFKHDDPNLPSNYTENSETIAMEMEAAEKSSLHQNINVEKDLQTTGATEINNEPMKLTQQNANECVMESNVTQQCKIKSKEEIPQPSAYEQGHAVVGSITSNKTGVICKMSISDDVNNKTVHFMYEKKRKHSENSDLIQNHENAKVSRTANGNSNRPIEQFDSVKQVANNYTPRIIYKECAEKLQNVNPVQVEKVFLQTPQSVNQRSDSIHSLQNGKFTITSEQNEVNRNSGPILKTFKAFTKQLESDKIDTRLDTKSAFIRQWQRAQRSIPQHYVQSGPIIDGAKLRRFQESIPLTKKWNNANENCVYETITPPPSASKFTEASSSRVPVIQYPVIAQQQPHLKKDINSSQSSRISDQYPIKSRQLFAPQVPFHAASDRCPLLLEQQQSAGGNQRSELRNGRDHYINMIPGTKFSDPQNNANLDGQFRDIELNEQLNQYRVELHWLEQQAKKRNEEKNELMFFYGEKLKRLKDLEREFSTHGLKRVPQPERFAQFHNIPHSSANAYSKEYDRIANHRNVSGPYPNELNIDIMNGAASCNNLCQNVNQSNVNGNVITKEINLSCSGYQNLYSMNVCTKNISSNKCLLRCCSHRSLSQNNTELSFVPSPRARSVKDTTESSSIQNLSYEYRKKLQESPQVYVRDKHASHTVHANSKKMMSSNSKDSQPNVLVAPSPYDAIFTKVPVTANKRDSHTRLMNMAVCHKCPRRAEYICSNCETIAYCSSICQASDWLQHSAHCAAKST